VATWKRCSCAAGVFRWLQALPERISPNQTRRFPLEILGLLGLTLPGVFHWERGGTGDGAPPVRRFPLAAQLFEC